MQSTTNINFLTSQGLHKTDELDYKKNEYNLSGHPVKEINFAGFDRTITSLDLSNCTEIVFIPESLKDLKFLEKLNLSNTFIDEKSLENLPCKHMATLILRDCKSLEKLPPSFKNFSQLECLDLSRSSIDSESLENLPVNLSSLALNRCKFIKNLPTSMKKLKDIEVLQIMIPKLSFESIENIPTDRLKLLVFHTDSRQYWAPHFDGVISIIYYAMTKSWEGSWSTGPNRSFFEKLCDAPSKYDRAEKYVIRLFNKKAYFSSDEALIFDHEKAARY